MVEPRISLPDASDVSESDDERESWFARSFEGVRNSEPVRSLHSLFASAADSNRDNDGGEASARGLGKGGGQHVGKDSVKGEDLADARPGTPPVTMTDLPGSADLVQPIGIDISTTEVHQSISTMQNMIDDTGRRLARPIQTTVPFASKLFRS